MISNIDTEVVDALMWVHPHTDWTAVLDAPRRHTPQDAVNVLSDALIELGYGVAEQHRRIEREGLAVANSLIAAGCDPDAVRRMLLD